MERLFFAFSLVLGLFFFTKKILQIRSNILQGRKINRKDQPQKRWKKVLLIAFGQQKMFDKPIVAFLHLCVYFGFVIINLELLEIFYDGLMGTHRSFAFLGKFYIFAISTFEILAVLVIISCLIFLIRRFILPIKRLRDADLKGFAQKDATAILVVEIVLMLAFLGINISESYLLKTMTNLPKITGTGLVFSDFLISQHLHFLVNNFSTDTLLTLLKTCFWIHFLGILLFLNYLPYSKHLHIVLAFPTSYFSKLEMAGFFTPNPTIANEVKEILGLSADKNEEENLILGAKDVQDLHWKNLMDAYSCTECGRCTEVCPAHQSGQLLSPRKIMMDTRDRLENGDQKGPLLEAYIPAEAILACTTCNACTTACPINLEPLDIILQLRQNLIMEEQKAPNTWTNAFNHIENAGSPWAFSKEDREKWQHED